VYTLAPVPEEDSISTAVQSSELVLSAVDVIEILNPAFLTLLKAFDGAEEK
jgi:hypothetical protein